MNIEKECTFPEVESLIKTLNNNDRRLDGEDGGVAINTLAEHLIPDRAVNAGRVVYGMGGVCVLQILVYNYKDWKFVVQDDQEVNPVHDGGMVCTGTVDLYNINCIANTNESAKPSN
jgi:hypothetical protein